MKKISIGLALACLVAFTAAQVQARGGGHREAPRSGGGERSEGNRENDDRQRSEGQRNEGQRSEIKQNTNTQSRTQSNAVQHANTTQRANTAQNQASQVHAHYSPQSQPFSSGWYGSHPQAWQAGRVGNWAGAGLGAATAWLGMAGTGDDDDSDNNTYLTGSVSDDDDSNDDDNNQPAATDSSQPVQNVQAQPVQNYQPQPAVAAQLAQSGKELAANSDWLPLGVFALKAEKQSEATAMLQLSVNKQGTLRGSYYDVVSDQGQEIQGGVDKKTRGVAWKVGSNGQAIFETDLSNLTKASGPVSLHFANGQTRQWSLTRLENPPATN